MARDIVAREQARKQAQLRHYELPAEYRDTQTSADRRKYQRTVRAYNQLAIHGRVVQMLP